MSDVQRVQVRYHWIQHPPYHPPTTFAVPIADDEWVVNVEAVPPNPGTGSGTRTWIARLA